MSEENKAMARRFYEEFVNKGDQSVADQLVSPDFVDHNPMDPDLAHGLQGLRRTFATFRSGIPDMAMSLEDQIAEGNKVVSRVTVTGTHKGDFMGVPATGKSFSIGVVDILGFRGGKIAERWGEADFMGMMQQLGLAPTPGQG